MNNELHDFARACYVRVNEMVIEALDAMVPLILAGAETPEQFASSEAWFKAQDAIEKAVADGNKPRVELLCNEYEKRAEKYCRQVVDGMRRKVAA